MSNSTFIDDLLSGNATIDEYDDYVDEWHDRAGLATDAPSLAQFLGLSDEEYAVVFRNPASFRFVAAARRHKIPLSDLLTNQSDFALAARTSDEETARELVGMLRAAGKLPPAVHGF